MIEKLKDKRKPIFTIMQQNIHTLFKRYDVIGFLVC